MAVAVDPDPAKVEEQAGRVLGYLSGTMVSIGVWLGDQLGLYRAMAGAGPLTSAELATRLGLHERWVREWLAHQASAGLLAHSRGELFELSPDTALVLADESTPASVIGLFGGLRSLLTMAEGLPDSFKTGRGHRYDDRGIEQAINTRRATRVNTGIFVDLAIPSLTGVGAKLEAGARVADIGCGAGVRLIALAQRYPRSEFHGYDISNFALGLAREDTEKAGLTNLTFHNPEADPLPGDRSFDLVTFGDVVHDLAFPDQVMKAVRTALKPDGTVLVIDMAAGETPEENIAHPMAPLLFGYSQLVCLSSSLSEEGGAGIGTLGLSPSRLRKLCEDAGFTRFRTTDVEDRMNNYYEIRP